MDRRGMPQKIREELNTIAAGMQSHANQTDKEMVLADALYDYIEELVRASYRRPAVHKATVTERIDRIVLHRVWALPIFAFFMFLMFLWYVWPVRVPAGRRMEYLIQEVLSPAIRGLLITARRLRRG